jgi:hypothetical protein
MSFDLERRSSEIALVHGRLPYIHTPAGAVSRVLYLNWSAIPSPRLGWIARIRILKGIKSKNYYMRIYRAWLNISHPLLLILLSQFPSSLGFTRNPVSCYN